MQEPTHFRIIAVRPLATGHKDSPEEDCHPLGRRRENYLRARRIRTDWQYILRLHGI